MKLIRLLKDVETGRYDIYERTTRKKKFLVVRSTEPEPMTPEEMAQNYNIENVLVSLFPPKRILVAKQEKKNTVLENVAKSLAIGSAILIIALTPLANHFVLAKNTITPQEAKEELSVKPGLGWKNFTDELPRSEITQSNIKSHNYDLLQPYRDALLTESVVRGYTDGSFKPERKITRAELATMLVKAFHIDTKNISPTVKFKDVSNGAWYYKYVEASAAAGLVKGYNDGTFKPNNNVTNAEAITMAIRALEARGAPEKNVSYTFNDVDPGKWYYSIIEDALQEGLFPNDTDALNVIAPNGQLQPNSPANRGKVAVWIWQAYPNKDGDSDRLTDIDEWTIGTNPKSSDTDGDRIKDGDDKNPLLPFFIVKFNFNGDGDSDYKNYKIFKMDSNDFNNEFIDYNGSLDTKTFGIHNLSYLIERDHTVEDQTLINNKNTNLYNLYESGFIDVLKENMKDYISTHYPTGDIDLNDLLGHLGEIVADKYRTEFGGKPPYGFYCGDRYFWTAQTFNWIFENYENRYFSVDDEKEYDYRYRGKDFYVSPLSASITRVYYSNGTFIRDKPARINHAMTLILTKDKAFYITNLSSIFKSYAMGIGPFFKPGKNYSDYAKYMIDNHVDSMVIQADEIKQYHKNFWTDPDTTKYGLLTYTLFKIPWDNGIDVYSDWPTYKTITDKLINNNVRGSLPFFRIMSSRDTFDRGKYLIIYNSKAEKYLMVKVSDSLFEKYESQYKQNPDNIEVINDILALVNN